MSEKSLSPVEYGVWNFRVFGEKKTLADVVRSPSYPLSDSDRALVADFIEGKIKLPKGKPPGAYLLDPKRFGTMPIRAAAFEVERLRAESRAEGKSARGNAENNIEKAVQKYCPPNTRLDVFAEKLRQYMRRPKRLRELD